MRITSFRGPKHSERYSSVRPFSISGYLGSGSSRSQIWPRSKSQEWRWSITSPPWLRSCHSASGEPSKSMSSSGFEWREFGANRREELLKPLRPISS